MGAADLVPLDTPYGTKSELVAMVDGVVTARVGDEPATAERARSPPWSEEREDSSRCSFRSPSSGTRGHG
ncbi:hypothetical protein [Streptomyces fructofermentans]|uniref:Uncharacterized protein n=1 Tax=Streptomyces fructofermentans TaxID=152141 RepID=A0A918K4U8_9ACTN|nr:hypothetical protein [Streptomyces fructofermentans]GGX50007.1 hypothetical protein GCM10010515_16590 [Streptomyces fructofermentans]